MSLVAGLTFIKTPPEFVILCNNRWVKIEVTAQQQSFFTAVSESAAKFPTVTIQDICWTELWSSRWRDALFTVSQVRMLGSSTWSATWVACPARPHEAGTWIGGGGLKPPFMYSLSFQIVAEKQKFRKTPFNYAIKKNQLIRSKVGGLHPCNCATGCVIFPLA